jgi:hypothetical protein
VWETIRELIREPRPDELINFLTSSPTARAVFRERWRRPVDTRVGELWRLEDQLLQEPIGLEGTRYRENFYDRVTWTHFAQRMANGQILPNA